MKLSNQRLRDVFLVLFQHDTGASRQQLEEMRTSIGPHYPRAGILDAVNDSVSQWAWRRANQRKLDAIRREKGLPTEKHERDQVDRVLKSQGLPTLLELELELQQKHRRIIGRKRIRNDEEFYLVKEILDGPTLGALQPDERELLASLMTAYEDRKKG
jgi:hypothetical protein